MDFAKRNPLKTDYTDNSESMPLNKTARRPQQSIINVAKFKKCLRRKSEVNVVTDKISGFNLNEAK